MVRNILLPYLCLNFSCRCLKLIQLTRIGVGVAIYETVDNSLSFWKNLLPRKLELSKFQSTFFNGIFKIKDCVAFISLSLLLTSRDKRSIIRYNLDFVCFAVDTDECKLNLNFDDKRKDAKQSVNCYSIETQAKVNQGIQLLR